MHYVLKYTIHSSLDSCSEHSLSLSLSCSLLRAQNLTLSPLPSLSPSHRVRWFHLKTIRQSCQMSTSPFHSEFDLNFCKNNNETLLALASEWVLPSPSFTQPIEASLLLLSFVVLTVASPLLERIIARCSFKIFVVAQSESNIFQCRQMFYLKQFSVTGPTVT